MVAHSERKAQRTLHRLAGAARWPVEIVADLDALAAALDPDSIAIVDAALARSRPGIRAQPARAWIAVPGDGAAAAAPDTIDALLEAGWTHVASHPMPILAEELLATLLKIIHGDPFGLEKYLAGGAEVSSYPIGNTADRDAAVATLARDVVAAGLPERAGSLASVIADELLTNALYAAPVDADGQRFRAREARDHCRDLAGRDAVTVRWATDARYLAIAVRDHWGSLDEGAVATRLASGAKKASEGEGGMGLPLVYACCTQLVIGSAPSEMTEVIALLDVRYRPTELARSASFHAFRGAGGGG